MDLDIKGLDLQQSGEIHKRIAPCNEPALPVELYREIFDFVFQSAVEDYETGIYTHVRVDTPLILGSVCRRWRSIVLDMPTLWTFIYSRAGIDRSEESSSDSDLEDDFAHSSRDPSKQGINPKRRRRYPLPYGLQCSRDLRSLFLRRSAKIPVRMCVVDTVKYGWAQISDFRFTPAHLLDRITHISFRLRGEVSPWFTFQSLLHGIDREVENLMAITVDHPTLTHVDITGMIDRRLTRIVYKIDSGERKPVELTIHEDHHYFWERLSGIKLECFSRLTLSTMDLTYSTFAAEVLQRAGVTLTYLELSNVSWRSLPWARILKAFASLTRLRLEQTKPVYHFTTIIVSDVEQSRRLQESLLDILPGLVGSLLRLEYIELITKMPLDADSLVDFVSSRSEKLGLEARKLQIAVTRATFVESELDALREMASLTVV